VRADEQLPMRPGSGMSTTGTQRASPTGRTGRRSSSTTTGAAPGEKSGTTEWQP
jgi:hypothetical protein